MNTFLAQKLTINGTNTTIEGRLPAGRFTNLSSLLTNALTLIFPIAGVILLAMLVWGGLDYLTSMGDPKKAGAGKTKITNAIIGIVILFASYWIVQIADFVFKLGIYTKLPPPPTP